MIHLKYQLIFTNKAKKDIERLPSSLAERLSKTFTLITQNPFCGKPLKGELHNLYSYRMGDYRIIYQIEKAKILVIILKIGHRKNVYK